MAGSPLVLAFLLPTMQVAAQVLLIESPSNLTLANSFASITFDKDPHTGLAHSTIDAIHASGFTNNLLRRGQAAYWNFVQMPDGHESKDDCTFSNQFVGEKVEKNSSDMVEISFEHSFIIYKTDIYLS